MTRTGTKAITIAAVGIFSLTAWVSAQAPAAGARHIRSAPIQVGRHLSQPVMDALGSFSPLPGAPRAASIFGIVQNHMGVLVPYAGTVNFRDLLTGRIAGSTVVNELAQFSMRAVPPGLYAAELVGPSGAIISSTAAFTAAGGEVIQLSQTIPLAPVAGLARGVESATRLALSTAASSGVLAITPGSDVTPQ